jgi:hypothetical protein
MTQGLLAGLASLAIALGLLIIGLPNKNGESPRFLRSYAAPMFYPPIILIFFALGIAEVIVWAMAPR